MNQATSFAERRVGVRVRAARHRDHRGELGVAQAGERAAEAGDQEGDDEGGAGVVGGRRAGQHEDARADDRADAEQHQCARVERAVQLVAGVGLVQLADRLGGEQAMRHVAGSSAGQCRRTYGAIVRECTGRRAPDRLSAQSSRRLGHERPRHSTSASYTFGVPATTLPPWWYSPPVERADAAAGLGDQQRAGRGVPGVEADLPEAVDAAGGHVGEVERGGAGAADAGGLLHHRLEHRQVLVDPARCWRGTGSPCRSASPRASSCLLTRMRRPSSCAPSPREAVNSSWRIGS